MSMVVAMKFWTKLPWILHDYALFSNLRPTPRYASCNIIIHFPTLDHTMSSIHVDSYIVWLMETIKDKEYVGWPSCPYVWVPSSIFTVPSLITHRKEGRCYVISPDPIPKLFLFPIMEYTLGGGGWVGALLLKVEMDLGMIFMYSMHTLTTNDWRVRIPVQAGV